MEEKGLIVTVLIAIVIVALLNVIFMMNQSSIEVDEEAIAQKSAQYVLANMPVVPTAAEISAGIVIPTMPEISIPEIQNADNVLLNEFLESEFSVEFNDIESEAEDYALEELEDHDYKVVVEYLMSLIEGIDEERISINVDETDLEVTKLGLEEEEDKSAIVTFEIKVNYRLEEGVNTRFNKNVVVVYNVLFDEGVFTDEDVELVSII